MHYIRIIFLAIFHNNPLAKISEIYQSSEGWVTVLTTKFTGQQYLIKIQPIKSVVIIKNSSLPNTADELIKMNERKS